MPHNQTCDLETYGLELECTRDLKAKVLVSVSRPGGQGLGLGLETKWLRSWSWSRDLVAKVLVLVSRPGHQGLGLGLEFFSKVLITSLLVCININRYYYKKFGFNISIHIFLLNDKKFNISFNVCNVNLQKFLFAYKSHVMGSNLFTTCYVL